MKRAHLSLALAGALAITNAGCADPVKEDLVAKLGPEDPAVPPGPLHRPGQPCLACHDGTGPAAMAMLLAGTVYQNPKDKTPLVAAKVKFTDARPRTAVAETNCAGNFFLQQADWKPTFPVHVAIEYGGTSIEMSTHIGREGSCATCHTGKDTALTVDQVYFNFDPMNYPPSGCK